MNADCSRDHSTLRCVENMKKGELMWSASVENDSLLDSDSTNEESRGHVRALVSFAPETVVPPRKAIRGVASRA